MPKSMAKSRKYENETGCDGRKKNKSKYSKLEEREVCCQEENQGSSTHIKKRKKCTETEEAPVPVSVPKSRKQTVESAISKVKNKKKSKRCQVQEDTEEAQTEKKKKKKRKKKSCEPEEPMQEVSATTAEDQGEEDEDEEKDLSPEERRALERKVKKIRKQEEKRKLKAEGKDVEKAEATKPSAAQLALNYLTCWSEKREDWKFQKTRQTWLLQHMFDTEKVPDESFSMLLPYLEGLRGVARDTTVQKAETLVRQVKGEEAEEPAMQLSAQRAREVIQMLP